MRLATPLYNLALPMIGIVSLLCGSFSRRGFGYRILGAVLIAIMVRVAGVGAHSIVQDNLSLVFIHYLIPISAIACCALFLSGFDPNRFAARWQKPAPAPVAVGAE
jgi:lipopolysaccharide export LptBFGC system permease protein LptF